MARYFHRSDLVLAASFDDSAALAVIDRDDLVVQTLVLDTLWVNGVRPRASRLTNDSAFVRALAGVLGGHAGSAVEGCAVQAVAAIVSLDAGARSAYGVTEL